MNIIKARIREIILIAVILLVGVVTTIVEPRFLTVANISNIFFIASVMGIMSVGMTLIIATGNIDVSVGSQFYMISAITAYLCVAWGGLNIPYIIVIGIAVGFCVSTLNAVIISFLKLPAIVVTLAMMSVLRGIVLVATDGRMVNLAGPFTRISTTLIGPARLPTVIWFIVSLIVFFLVYKVRFGREVLAVGSNLTAAERIGIDKRKIYIITFALSGVLTGIAAVFYTAMIGTMHASVGVGYELRLIAAVVIGGTAFAGGRISLLGTFCGVVLMGVIDNTLTLMRVSMFWQSMTVGAVLLIAVVSSGLTSNETWRKERYKPEKTNVPGRGEKNA